MRAARRWSAVFYLAAGVASGAVVVLFAGLVSGEGWLRVPGLVGVVVGSMLAPLADHQARRHLRRQWRRDEASAPARSYEPGEHFDAVIIEWPRKRERTP